MSMDSSSGILLHLSSHINSSNMTTLSSNESSSHLGASEMDAIRQRLSDQMAMILLPAILIIGIVMIVGCIGNSLVFYVYLKKFNPSSTRSAILALASFDLVASCLSMPGEILDLRYSYNFQSEVECKAFRFFTMVVLIASGMTLVVVAVDRYRRICRPMNRQMTANQTKIWALVSLLVAILFSIPSPIMYGLSLVPTSIEGLYGRECSIDQKYKNHILPLVYNCILSLLFGTVFVTMIVMYSLLGRKVLKQNKFRYAVKRSLSQEDRDHSITDGGRDSRKESASSQRPDVVPETSFNISKERDAERKLSVASRKTSTAIDTRKASYMDPRTRKTTLMLFIITTVFVISFLPHLILKGIQAVKKNFLDNASNADIILYNILVRSYFFNSVANCFIYGFCSPKFRRECKKIFFKVFCCINRK